MQTTNWALACGSAIGVQADNVGKDDDPDSALDREALHLCPLGYDRLSVHTLLDGKTVIWGIECHPQQGQAQKTHSAC
jgi:hypothetical protein